MSSHEEWNDVKFIWNNSLSSTTAVHIWIISYKLHIISLLTGRYSIVQK